MNHGGDSVNSTMSFPYPFILSYTTKKIFLVCQRVFLKVVHVTSYLLSDWLL